MFEENVKIILKIVNMNLFDPPCNRERKNENKEDEEKDDGAEGGREDVELRLQVEHPRLRVARSEHVSCQKFHDH